MAVAARAARAADTRSHLVRVGRRLFAERGYGSTATEDIVAAAGVTRGALYHHFRDKQDLFRAVFEQVEDEIYEKVTAAAMSQETPWDGLLAGCTALLDAGLDPAIQRIAVVDAPAVLGWEVWRDVGSQRSFGLVATGLEWAMGAGEIEDRPAEPLALMLLGAVTEGARYVAGVRSRDRRQARDVVVEVITRILEGLRPAGS